jgi:hypothetical protein
MAFFSLKQIAFILRYAAAKRKAGCGRDKGLPRQPFGIMGQIVAYAAQYLALSEHLQAQFWSADRKLHKHCRESRHFRIHSERRNIMVSSDQFAGYLTLLKIRQLAYRRNMWITGALFVMTFILTIGLGLITGWSERSIYIMAVFIILSLIGYLMAWARLEILRGNIELMNNLSRMGNQAR